MVDRYTELLHTHFQHSVLDSLPEWLSKMDDTYGDGLSMGTSSLHPYSLSHLPSNPSSLGLWILDFGGVADQRVVSKPNMNLPVLVYCRRDCGEITLEE